jgi:hypothetical protein
MKNQIAKIQTEIDSLNAKLEKVSATRAAKSGQRDAVTTAINQAQTDLHGANQGLAATLADQALNGGSDEAVATARSIVTAAMKTLDKVKVREAEIFELSAVIDACDNQITKLSNEAASWAKQIRAIKIEALHAELDRRMTAYDEQVLPMYRLMFEAVAAEQYLRDLGEQPLPCLMNVRSTHIQQFRLEGVPTLTTDDLIRSSKQALAAEWQV